MHFIVLDCELIFDRNPLCVGLMWFQRVVSLFLEVSELSLLWPFGSHVLDTFLYQFPALCFHITKVLEIFGLHSQTTV